MNVVSLTSIATGAALQLGQEPVRDITDTDDDFAVLANARIDYCINAVMREHDWSCCKKRAILTATSNTPDFEYSYEFTLPSDYVKVLRVSAAGANSHYEIYGKTLQCNDATLQLEYLAYPTDISVIDYLMSEAISYYLAYDLCYKVVTDKEQKKELYTHFLGIMSQAKKADKEGNRRRQFRATGWKTARFSGEKELTPSDQITHS